MRTNRTGGEVNGLVGRGQNEERRVGINIFLKKILGILREG